MALYLGIDIGSTTSKAVLLDQEKRIVRTAIRPTGVGSRSVAQDLKAEILREEAGAEPVRVVATGYGRALVDYADRTITEITCHGRGVRFLHPDAAMILDIGGQDSKVIRLDEAGRVEDFGMNDRCAAGTGSFLDVIARRFDLDLKTLADIHTLDPTPFEISSTCVVFAETEVVSLLSQGHDLNDILAGVQRAVARRVVTLVRHVGFTHPIYFSGGVAQNETIRREIQTALGVSMPRARYAQYTAALGAALLAGE